MYRRYRKKTSLGRASLATIEERIASVEGQIASLEVSQRQAKLVGSQIDQLQLRILSIGERLSSLQKVRRPRDGFLAGLLGLTEQPDEIRTEVSSLEAERADLMSQRSKLDSLYFGASHYQRLIKKEQDLLEKLKVARERKLKKNNKIIELRAAAAANSDEARKLGSAVRRALDEQPFCPYCGGTLGDSPHADHIYPISKGGRSVPRNMVFACSPCNGMKSDLTLASFVRKYALDRAAIETRLEQLGKEF